MKIVLDIETLQASKEEWARLQGINLLSCPDDSDPATYEERNKKEYQKSAFDATFSRIICIGILFFSNDMQPLKAIAWYGSNEKEILRQFWLQMAADSPQLIITFNGLGFDLPFIKKRSVIHQVKPTMEINLAKFRTDPIYDVMAVWSNWELRGFTKLGVLARALGVETKSGSGDQVAGMWAEGKGKEIAEYCLQDTFVTYACYCRMTYRDPIVSSVVFSNKLIHQIE